MSTDDLTESVRRILETALGTSTDSAEDPRREDYERWDSLMQLELVFMLEERFAVRFTDDEILALSSLSGIASVLRAKQADR